MNTGEQVLQYPIRPTNAHRKFQITSTPMTATSHETLVSSILEAFAATVASSKTLKRFSPITPTANGFQVPTVSPEFVFEEQDWLSLGITTLLSQSVAQYVLLSLTCFVVDVVSTPGEITALHLDCQNKLTLAHTFLYDPSEFPRTVLTKDQAGEVFDTIVKMLGSMMPGLKFEVLLEPVLIIIIESFPVAVQFLCFETIAIFTASLVAAAYQTYKKQGTDLLEGLGEVAKAVAVQEGLVMSGRRKHKVYLITEFPLTKHAYTSASKVEFKVISYSDGDVKRLTRSINSIFTESSKLNRKVFIVCSSIGQTVPPVPVDTYSVMNDAFRDYFSNSANPALRNLVVIHETDDIAHVVIGIGSTADQRVRKICNVLNMDTEGKIAVENLDLVEDIEQDIFTLKSGEPVMYDVSPPQAPLSHDVALDDQWWFTNFNVNAPACADGRTTQITGSCWWNATINVLLMTESIADMLVEKWHSLPEDYRQTIDNIGLDACPDKSMQLKEFMYILINQLLVLGNRAKYSEDFSTYGALLTDNAKNKNGAFDALFKAQHTPGKRFLPQDLGRVQGGHPLSAVQVIFAEILEIGTDYAFVWLTAEEGKLMQTPGERLEFKNNTDLWEYFPSPKVIIVTCRDGNIPLRSCLPSIILNGYEYLLSSSAMTFPGHAVAGLTCGKINGKPDLYVYDSNNQLSRDDWPSGQVPNYMKLIRASKDPNDTVDRAIFKEFGFLIYTICVNKTVI